MILETSSEFQYTLQNIEKPLEIVCPGCVPSAVMEFYPKRWTLASSRWPSRGVEEAWAVRTLPRDFARFRQR